MKHKFTAAVMAAAMAAAGLTGCMEKKQPSSSNKSTETAVTTSAAGNDSTPNGEFVSESIELIKLKYADVPDLTSGPEFKISDTYAKPGEIAKVTVSVNGAKDKWNTCGIHVTYPEVLECQLENAENNSIKYELGDAVAGNSAFIAMDWRENLDEELVREHQCSFFLIMIGNGLLVLILNLIGLFTGLYKFLNALLNGRGTLSNLLNNLLVTGRELVGGVDGEYH